MGKANYSHMNNKGCFMLYSIKQPRNSYRISETNGPLNKVIQRIVIHIAPEMMFFRRSE